jgi:hypothetical protein
MMHTVTCSHDDEITPVQEFVTGQYGQGNSATVLRKLIIKVNVQEMHNAKQNEIVIITLILYITFINLVINEEVSDRIVCIDRHDGLQ